MRNEDTLPLIIMYYRNTLLCTGNPDVFCIVQVMPGGRQGPLLHLVLSVSVITVALTLSPSIQLTGRHHAGWIMRDDTANKRKTQPPTSVTETNTVHNYTAGVSMSLASVHLLDGAT